MNISRNLGIAILLGFVGFFAWIILLVVFAYPPGSWNSTSAPAGQQQAENQQASQLQSSQEGVTRDQAEEIALAHIGEGEVTWTSQENDHGAQWEIEVTRPNGNEANVYVASNGEVTHVAGDSSSSDSSSSDSSSSNSGNQQAQPQQAQPAQPEGGTIDAQQAGQIAAAHVGGTVDTVHRESGGDYGAAWDVDVYSDEGEYIVYVSATGEVTHVEGPFNW